ncbi:MAG: hypothetical protein WEE20_12715, partial [Bacteroidota bacterium]
WTPNKVRLFDDGSHGDQKGDGIWTLELQLPPGLELEYKYTNSGPEGNWNPGDESPMRNRRVHVMETPGGKQIIRDIFGVM